MKRIMPHPVPDGNSHAWSGIDVYAIIQDGEHQYKVQEGETLDVQLHELDENAETIEFDHVIMLGDGADSRIGHPYVQGAKVIARLEGEVQADKIHIYKFKRRKNYRRKTGHRQRLHRVIIEKIQA